MTVGKAEVDMSKYASLGGAFGPKVLELEVGYRDGTNGVLKLCINSQASEHGTAAYDDLTETVTEMTGEASTGNRMDQDLDGRCTPCPHHK
jgi:hypothetical protein